MARRRGTAHAELISAPAASGGDHRVGGGCCKRRRADINEGPVGWNVAAGGSHERRSRWCQGRTIRAEPERCDYFSNDGHFSLFQSRAQIPTIATNDRAKATPQEAQEIVAGAIAYYGTYRVSEGEKTVFVKIAASTFANCGRWSGAEETCDVADRRRAQVHQLEDARGRYAVHGLETGSGAVADAPGQPLQSKNGIDRILSCAGDAKQQKASHNTEVFVEAFHAVDFARTRHRPIAMRNERTSQSV